MAGKYIPLNDEIFNYVAASRTNAFDPILNALQLDSEPFGDGQCTMVGPDQAGLISLLVPLINTKWAVEVGTFTGTSSICIARHLALGGKLVCFDSDFKVTSVARRYWIRAGVQDKIDLRLGDARRLLPHYKPQNPIDFVFIDADKESYEFYYETILPYVRAGGLIVFDNMLRGGQVVHPVQKTHPVNRAIDSLNRKLASDNRVQCVMLPMSDGMTICRKLYVAGLEGRRPTETRRI